MSTMLDQITNVGESRKKNFLAAIRSSRCSKRKCLVCEKHRQPLFEFPKDDSICSSWWEFCRTSGDNIPAKRQFLCCVHFTSKSMMLSPSGKVKVEPNAIPTLRGPGSIVPKKRKPKKSRSLCYMCGQLAVGTCCFKFPKDNRLPTWLAFCGVQLTKPTARLCHAHFTPEDVMRERHRYVLKSSAVPIWHVPKSKVRDSKPTRSNASTRTKRKMKTNRSSKTLMNTSASHTINHDEVLKNEYVSKSDVQAGSNKQSLNRLMLELSVRSRFAAFTRGSLEESMKAISNKSCDTHDTDRTNIEQMMDTANSSTSPSAGPLDDEVFGTLSYPLSRVSLTRHRYTEEGNRLLPFTGSVLRPYLNTSRESNIVRYRELWMRWKKRNSRKNHSLMAHCKDQIRMLDSEIELQRERQRLLSENDPRRINVPLLPSI